MRPRESWSVCLAFVFVLALPTFTNAAGTGLGCEYSIQGPADLLTGPVLQGLVIASIVVFGLILAFSNPGPVWRTINQFFFALSLVMGVVTIGAMLLPHFYIDPAAAYVLYAAPVLAVGVFGAVVACVCTSLFGSGCDAQDKDAEDT